MERLAVTQIVDFMEETEQLNHNLHAYKAMFSTTTAILNITDSIAAAADGRKIAATLLLDQSAAFDCVDTQILLQKLEVYNFSPEARKWIESYLSNRTQFVEIGAQTSSMRSVRSGVPQGSVMGPILYAIYTNEFPETTKEDDCDDSSHDYNEEIFGKNCEECGIMTCYADDSTVVITSSRRGGI